MPDLKTLAFLQRDLCDRASSPPKAEEDQDAWAIARANWGESQRLLRSGQSANASRIQDIFDQVHDELVLHARADGSRWTLEVENFGVIQCVDVREIEIAGEAGEFLFLYGEAQECNGGLFIHILGEATELWLICEQVLLEPLAEAKVQANRPSSCNEECDMRELEALAVLKSAYFDELCEGEIDNWRKAESDWNNIRASLRLVLPKAAIDLQDFLDRNEHVGLDESDWIVIEDMASEAEGEWRFRLTDGMQILFLGASHCLVRPEGNQLPLEVFRGEVQQKDEDLFIHLLGIGAEVFVLCRDVRLSGP